MQGLPPSPPSPSKKQTDPIVFCHFSITNRKFEAKIFYSSTVNTNTELFLFINIELTYYVLMFNVHTGNFR